MNYLFILLRLVLVRFNDHRLANVSRFFLKSRQQFAKVRVDQIRQHDGNQARAFTAQLNRAFTGHITQVIHRITYRLARFGYHTGMIVQHPRYGSR
ncbi:hypothetical protein D3C75_756390 [compost metagenome]